MSPKSLLQRRFRKVLGDDFGKNLEARGIRKGQQVKLYVAPKGNSPNVVEVGYAKLSPTGAANETVQRTLHLHDLPQTDEQDLVVITGATFLPKAATLAYPYSFKGPEDPPKTLNQVFAAGLYPWDSRMMVAVEHPNPERLSPDTPQEPSVPPSSARLDSTSTPPRKRETHQNVSRDQAARDAPITPHTSKQPQPQTAEERLEQPQEPTAGDSGDDDVIFIGEASDHNDLAERGRQVAVRKYPLQQYVKREIKVHRSQLVKPARLLRVTDDKFVKQLQTDFIGGYDYDSGFMMVTVHHSENDGLEGLKFEDLIVEKEEVNDQNRQVLVSYLKKEMRAIIVDGNHRSTALDLLEKLFGQDDRFKWLHEHMRMILVLRTDGKDITNTELLCLGAQRNKITSLVRPMESLEDYLHATCSYFHSFADEHNLALDEVKPSNIAKEMANIKLIAKLKEPTYLRYANISKFLVKYPSAYQLLMSFKPSEQPKIGAAHLDNRCYLAVDEQGVLLFLHSINAYIRNTSAATTRSGDFPCTEFYKAAMNLYERCRYAFQLYGIPRKLSFTEFLATQTPTTTTKTTSIADYFTAKLRLFATNTRHDREMIETRAAQFSSKLNKFFDPPKPKNSSVPSSSPAVGDTPVSAPLSIPKGSSRAAPKRRSTRKRKPPAPSSPLQPANKAPKKASSSAVASTRKGNGNKASSSQVSRRKRVAGEEEHEYEDEDPLDLDEHGFLLPFQEKAHRGYDDFLPPRLPVGYQDSTNVYKGEDNPWWATIFSLCPDLVSNLVAKVVADQVHMHHTPCLHELHIPEGHRAHMFCTKDFLHYLNRLACFIACKKETQHLCRAYPLASRALHDDTWESVLKFYSNGQGSEYFSRQGMELQHRGFCILEGFADDSSVPSQVHVRLLRHKENAFNKSLAELYKHYVQAFPGQEALKDENKRQFWNPIINVGIAQQDEANRNASKARYSSTRYLLMEITEESPDTVWAAVRLTQLDVWIGMLASLVGITKTKEERIFVPVTGGRFLLTGKDCPRQTPHNDFQVLHRDEWHRSPGYFAIVSGPEPFPLWVSDYSHHFVYSTYSRLNQFAKALQLRKIIVLAMSVFFGHGYCTHAGAGYESRLNDDTTIRYHIYFLPEKRKAPDSVFFAFGYTPKFDGSNADSPSDHNQCQGDDDGDRTNHETADLRQVQHEEAEEEHVDDEDDEENEGEDDDEPFIENE